MLQLLHNSLSQLSLSLSLCSLGGSDSVSKSQTYGFDPFERRSFLEIKQKLIKFQQKLNKFQHSQMIKDNY